MNPPSSRWSSHQGVFAAGFYGVESRVWQYVTRAQGMKQAGNRRKVSAGSPPRKPGGCCRLLVLILSALLLSSREVVGQQIMALNCHKGDPDYTLGKVLWGHEEFSTRGDCWGGRKPSSQLFNNRLGKHLPATRRGSWFCFGDPTLFSAIHFLALNNVYCFLLPAESV